MRREVLVAGIGGRGVLVFGELIAKAGVKVYSNVVMSPSYFAFMRGGSSECTVILSDERIGSPILKEAGTVVVLDPSQIEPFLGRVREGGKFIYEGSELEGDVGREGIISVKVPAQKKAIELGGIYAMNMVLLGFYTGLERPVPPELVEEEIRGEGFGGCSFLKPQGF